MNTYDVGDLIRCTGTFTDITGTAIDPAVVIFQFKNPSGTITAYTYGTDVALVRSSTGHYYVDVNGNAEGRWYYRYHSTGNGQAASEGSFTIQESAF